MNKPFFSEDFFQNSEIRSRTFRFAGRKATSQIVVLPLLLLLSLNMSSSGIAADSFERLILLRVTFAAFAVAWLFFTIAGWLINLLVPQTGNLRNWLILFLYGLTETIRTVLLHLFSLGAGLESQANWLYRLTGGFTTGIVLFAIVSTVLNDSGSYRDAYHSLLERRDRLQSVVQASQENLTRTRDQLVNSVQKQLTVALRSSLTETEKSAPEFTRIISNLFSVAEHVVRPLSHELFDQPIQLRSENPRVSTPRIPVGMFLRDSSTTAPFRAGVFTAITALITFPSLFLIVNLFYSLLWVISILLIYTSFWIARRYFYPVLLRANMMFRIVLMSLVYSLPTAGFSVLIFANLGPGVEVSAESILYGSILGLGTGWLLAASVGMRSSRLRMLTEVESMNEELFWLNARLQSELWLDQKNLALTLHNDVQATLLAAALKLKASVVNGDVQAHDTLPEIRELISRSINFATVPNPRSSLTDSINRINENWAGLITMQFTASSDTVDAIQSDPIGLGVLEDVLSEFQNNSLKHGRATQTEAILTTPKFGVLLVTLSNNGERLDTAVEGGLGSAFLTSVALNYEFENLAEGVRLSVQLPLSATTKSL